MNMVRRKWSLALAVVLLVALIAVPAMANLDGYVWNDVNGNGVLDKDANNNPLESVIPWLRADGGGFELKYWKSSTCGTGTPVVEYWDTYVNPANGAISVHVPLPNAGTATWCYELRQIDKPGWVRTKPVSPDYYTGTFTGNNPQVTQTRFGNYQCTVPSITSQPTGATKNVGESVTFSVSADGTAPLSYQWRKDGTDISGATGSSYTISPVATTDGGIYDVKITNSCGSVTSNGATLGVEEPIIPVPEFPTIAVSILTLSGMFIAVQFMKKRN
jgi:hypothetical protein